MAEKYFLKNFQKRLDFYHRICYNHYCKECEKAGTEIPVFPFAV